MVHKYTHRHTYMHSSQILWIVGFFFLISSLDTFYFDTKHWNLLIVFACLLSFSLSLSQNFIFGMKQKSRCNSAMNYREILWVCTHSAVVVVVVFFYHQQIKTIIKIYACCQVKFHNDFDGKARAHWLLSVCVFFSVYTIYSAQARARAHIILTIRFYWCCYNNSVDSRVVFVILHFRLSHFFVLLLFWIAVWAIETAIYYWFYLRSFCQ